jgi:hypothetical protein
MGGCSILKNLAMTPFGPSGLSFRIKMEEMPLYPRSRDPTSGFPTGFHFRSSYTVFVPSAVELYLFLKPIAE